MNNFSCTARLGRDGEVRVLNSGTSVCTFTGAVDAGYGDRKTTLWIRFAIFGKRAEGKLPQYLVKGCQVAITGELSMNEWEDKEGNKRSTLECNVRELDLIGGRAESKPAKQDAFSAPSDTGNDCPF